MLYLIVAVTLAVSYSRRMNEEEIEDQITYANKNTFSDFYFSKTTLRQRIAFVFPSIEWETSFLESVILRHLNFNGCELVYS